MDVMESTTTGNVSGCLHFFHESQQRFALCLRDVSVGRGASLNCVNSSKDGEVVVDS
jgi:hypothetical protein